MLGALPGTDNKPKPLPCGIMMPGDPPPRGVTVAKLPLLDVTVPATPHRPNTGVPRSGRLVGGERERLWAEHEGFASRDLSE